jgi:3-oxoacyl-[acyl-carrier protein] reductase
MDLGIRGKVALVTGGSSGLGLACARSLAREGVRLAIAARDAARLDAAAQDLQADAGGAVLALPADVSKPAQASELVREVSAKLGPVEILVANAGGPKPGRFEDFGWDEWLKSFELVVGSVHHLVSAVLPGMRSLGRGRIVSIQSMSIRQPVESLLLSNSLRPAAAGLLKGLAGELAPAGITVNVVGPGSSRTDRILELGRHRNPGASDAEVLRTLGTHMPIGRLVEPVEVGAAVAYLCSVHAAAITGAFVPVDGGQIRNQL